MKILNRLALCVALFATSGSFAQTDPAPPSGYPAGYAALIEAARKEQTVLVYSNLPESYWAPVVAIYRKKYPWLSVQTLDMGGELWERYYAESAAGTRTADLIVTSTIDRWIEFVDKKQVADHVSPETPNLPEWSRPFPGLYTLSADPLGIVYNKLMLPEDKAPASLADVARLATERPAALKGRITTYDAAANPYGLALYWAWIKGHEGDWSVVDAFAPLTRPERSSGTMLEKVISGEYTIGVFLSATNLPRLTQEKIARIAGFRFPADGTPVTLRGGAVTKAASSPNAARLLLDVTLSREGQIAFAQAGLTPYREDITRRDVPFNTLATIRESVGADKIFFMTYDRGLLSAREGFVARWKQAFREGGAR